MCGSQLHVTSREPSASDLWALALKCVCVPTPAFPTVMCACVYTYAISKMFYILCVQFEVHIPWCGLEVQGQPSGIGFLYCVCPRD